MRADMSVGVQASDIDIAFSCSIIPHDQRAISMARIQRKYGQEPENNKLAEAIIKAQVERKLEWLEGCDIV
jgi:uncharacterized protein (DUF305 family)